MKENKFTEKDLINGRVNFGNPALKDKDFDDLNYNDTMLSHKYFNSVPTPMGENYYFEGDSFIVLKNGDMYRNNGLNFQNSIQLRCHNIDLENSVQLLSKAKDLGGSYMEIKPNFGAFDTKRVYDTPKALINDWEKYEKGELNQDLILTDAQLYKLDYFAKKHSLTSADFIADKSIFVYNEEVERAKNAPNLNSERTF